MGATAKSVTDATLELGQSCPLICSFPSAVHCLVKHAGSFPEAVLATICAGGDNAGRAAMIGAWLGACHGVNAIPIEWRQHLTDRSQIEQCLAKLLRSFLARTHVGDGS
jgi:ADP-ribosylglycohydrolase